MWRGRGWKQGECGGGGDGNRVSVEGVGMENRVSVEGKYLGVGGGGGGGASHTFGEDFDFTCSLLFVPTNLQPTRAGKSCAQLAHFDDDHLH